MKYFLTVLMIAVLAIGCSEKPEETRDRLHQKALTLLDEYRFDEADATFFDVIKADSLSLLGPEGLALSQERRWLFWDALHYYMKICENDPNSLVGHRGAARMFRWLGYPDRALTHMNRVRAFLGEDDEATATVAIYSLGAAQYSAAARLANKAVEWGLEPGIGHMILSRAYLEFGQVDSAQIHAASALSEDAVPESPFYHLVVADYLEDLGQFNKAIEHSQTAWELSNGEFEYLVDHFERCLRLGYFYDARQMIDALPAAAEGTSPPAVMDLKYRLAANRGFEVGAAAASLLHVEDMAISSFLYDAGACNYRHDNATYNADLETASAQVARGNYAESFREFFQLYIALAEARNTERYAKAIRNVEYFSEGQYSPYVQQLGRLDLYARANHDAKFEPLLDTIMSTHMRDVRWMVRVGDICSDSVVGRYEQAEEAYRAALQVNNANRDAYYGLLDIYLHRGEIRRAASALRSVEFNLEDFADVQADQALFLLEHGFISEGIEPFLATIEPVSGQIARFKKALERLTEAGDEANGQRIVDVLLKLNGENPDALLVATDWYLAQNNSAKAGELVDHGLELEPDNHDLQATRARLLAMAGENEDAKALFEEVAKATDENNARLLRYYSRFLADQQEDVIRAQNLARRGTFADQENIHDGFTNLCYVYMLTGRPDLAGGEARRGINTFQKSAELHYYRGYALYLQKQEGARDHLQKALDYGITGEDRKRAESALKDLAEGGA